MYIKAVLNYSKVLSKRTCIVKPEQIVSKPCFLIGGETRLLTSHNPRKAALCTGV